MDDAEFDRALIAAAFQVAAEQGWRRLSVAAAARAGGLPLPRARERFPGRAAILLRFGRLADQAALADAPSEGPIRDRLFDLLMRRIDALQSHRGGVLALLRALPSEPPFALLLGSRHAAQHAVDAGGRWGVHRRRARRIAGPRAGRRLALDGSRLARRRDRGPGSDHGGTGYGAASRRTGRRMVGASLPRIGTAGGTTTRTTRGRRRPGLSLVALPPIKGV